MKKKKISELSNTTQMSRNNKFLIYTDSPKLLSLFELNNLLCAGFPNIAPSLSSFSLGSGWSITDGKLIGTNIAKWVSAISPAFPVTPGKQYTLSAFFDNFDTRATVQPTTGSNQFTRTIAKKGLAVISFIATSASCTINVFSPDDGVNNITLSSLRVEEGAYPTGVLDLIIKNLTL